MAFTRALDTGVPTVATFGGTDAAGFTETVIGANPWNDDDTTTYARGWCRGEVAGRYAFQHVYATIPPTAVTGASLKVYVRGRLTRTQGTISAVRSVFNLYGPGPLGGGGADPVLTVTEPGQTYYIDTGSVAFDVGSFAYEFRRFDNGALATAAEITSYFATGGHVLLQPGIASGGGSGTFYNDFSAVAFGYDISAPWPLGTDFDTFPAEAAGLSAGTILNTGNSILSRIWDYSQAKLILDATHAHSGSLAMTGGGVTDDMLVYAELASDAAPVAAVAETFWYWLYYQPPDRLDWGVGEPWLSAYAFCTGPVGEPREDYWYQLAVVYLRRVGTECQWRVLFDDNSEATVSGPLQTWTKIQVEAPLTGRITVRFSTDAGELGIAQSVPGYMTSLNQYFAMHELHVRKEPIYGQMWIDDINYDIPAPVIVGRPDLSRRRFT